MATTPDANPDSRPAGQPDDIEQVSPADTSGRESIEDTPDGGNSTSAP